MEDYLVKMQGWLMFYGVKALAALIIFILGRWIAQALRRLTARVLTKREVEPVIVSFVGSLTYIALITFVVIAAIAQLGIQTTSFIALIGAAGLAVGLALQGSLANFAAGFLLIIFRPFKGGDYIEAAGVSGVVEDLHIFTTQIKTVDNKTIIIPNGKIMGDVIVNYTAKDTRRIDVLLGVSYGDDIDKVRGIIEKAVAEDERILRDPSPAIIVKALADSSVNFEARVWVKTGDYWDVYFALVEKVKKRFDAEGITIPFPQTDVHLYQQG